MEKTSFWQSEAADKKKELQLIAKAAKGDSQAFSRLVARYHRRVAALGMSFFKNATDTEDFLQDVFIKVYTKLHTFRGESLFSTWLLRIAYTTAVNSIKRRQEYLPISDETILFDKDYTPEERQLRQLTIEVLQESIKELPEKHALCLDLYFFYDLPYKEIEEITGIPLNTVKSHIFKKKKMLKEKIESKL